MAPRFYNTATRDLQEIKPIHPGAISIYGCGPTVHNFAHIGNLRAFLFYDLVRQYLKFRGFKVKFVMNVTDVEDKIINALKTSKMKYAEFTDHYTQEFLNDLKTLGAEPPDALPRASQEIRGMVKMIEDLIAGGHAYKTQRGNVYFRVSSFSDYGKIAQLSQRELKANADGRMDAETASDKEDIVDFALWKAWDADDGEVYWDTTLGKGRPGWHIECSVMSTKHLGAPFDLHLGGIDLLFPHHTNEIAQAECALHGPFVNHWMHNGHLMVNGKKMSKSLHNFFTLRDLLDKGYEPTAIRYELLKSHYRAQSDFREESVIANQKIVRRFTDFFSKLKNAPGDGPTDAARAAKITAWNAAFMEAMDDDLNISKALAVIHEAVGELGAAVDQLSASERDAAIKLISGWNSVLLFFEATAPAKASEDLSDDLKALIKAREDARKNKDFKLADSLRAELLAKGIKIEDSAGGTKWERA